MAEKDPTSAARPTGPELRLLDRRAFVGFPSLTLAPGVVVTDFALQIPDVTFPLNVSGGASKYQKKKLDFGLMELVIDAEVITRQVRALSNKLPELDEVKLHFRPGHLEVQARLRGAERTPLTFKVAFDGDGERLAVYFYDVRLYAFSTTPAARLGAILTEAIKAMGVLPEVERRGANGFTTRILPEIVERAAVGRGYKMPALEQARLAEAIVSSKGLTLRFSAGGLPPPGTPDEELLLALEGTRAFAEAEELLAQGQLKEARAAYLVLGDATEAHPFAVERLLTLLVADLQAHELALDVAASLHRRRERSATALWAEAVVRERRGEFARAAERYLALCNLARKNQEEAGAFFAAEASARASRDHAPQMAVKALHELLGLKPDHLPSLKALARASDQANDRAGAIRAYRRLAALARDPADAAEAHVQLARLCAQTEDDLAGARLHCEAALRLAPDHPEALFQLGELCYRSGEWLRAIKALDRLREVAMSRHEVERVGRANLLAGLVWETGLKQPENALLRFREAASLMPGDAEPLYLAARVAESLGKLQEAVSGFQQAVELAGPSPRTEALRKAAHASHHALARLLKTRLGEPARAREHLEAALALDPQDRLALDELLPYFRASGKAVELAEAAEKAAAVIDEPSRRAALWAEAGELYRGRLNQPERAERLLSQALEADPKNRQALEGMLALAESRRDGGQLCRCLKALAELSEDAKERVRHYRRLAVAARDLAFDLELAAHAYREVLRVEPEDMPVLGELTALERRRSDMAGLSWALEQRARVAEQLGDKRLAAAALRELSGVLDARLGRAGEALVALEKSSRLFPEVNTLMDLATLSLRVERPLNARRALEDVLALLPKHAPPDKLAEVRARLGRACELLGDKDGARENYALAFPLRRLDDELAGRLEALYAEGRFTRELTDLWAARAQALQQAGRAHDAAPLFFKAAQTALEAGDLSGAMLRLTAALDAAPAGERAGETLELMASLELKRGEPVEAARLFGRRAALADGREAARWFFRAATLTRDTPREAAFLASTLERDETFVPARLRRAELVEVSNPREALVDFEAVLGADPRDDDVAAMTFDPIALTRRAAIAAQKSGQYDAARRLFARYVASKPDDVEALLELAGLHRRAGALEPLVDLLGEVWPRLSGAPKTAARREYAEGALTLGRTAAAIEALRAMLADAPNDDWAASRLLTLLPAEDGNARERLTLISRLIEAASGDLKAELLARRAELYRRTQELDAARADLLEASQVSSRPLPLLRALAEYARQAKDEVGELTAWRLVLERSRGDTTLREDAAERLAVIARGRVGANDFARALEAYEALVTLPLEGTERFEAWSGLAFAARAVDSPRRAEQALLEASKQGPTPRRVEALLQRAALLEGRKALSDAVQALGEALALAPRHPQATASLVRDLRALEDWEGLAEVLASEAAQTPREQAVGLYEELASLYLDRLKEPGPGEAALRRLLTIDPARVPARRRLASLLVARGEFLSAVAELEGAAEHLTPPDAATLLREAALLAREGQDDTLQLKLMRRAHGLSPAVGDELERLADALYLRGAMREALPLQSALAASVTFDERPENAERILLRLADLAEQTDDLGLAEATLKRVVAERPLNGLAVERLANLMGRSNPLAALQVVAKHLETLAPSARTSARLLSLAREAATVHRDLDVATRLFGKAAEGSDDPLAVRLELVDVLRRAGRTAELMTQLQELAQLHIVRGEVDAALAAWDEESRLAEGSGRIDDALRTLTAMAQLSEEEALTTRAAQAELRRAQLLRDSKLDLDGAAQALEHAWELEPATETAEFGLALAQRRTDREGEIDWVERSIKLAAPVAQAALFVQLARLHLGMPATGGEVATAPMLAPDQAEAALHRALELDADRPDAEALLLALLERQGRLGDVAAWYEEAASRSRDPRQRADLLLKAAGLYKDRADRPQEAAAALLAARAANPDDLSLTARVADSLMALGRRQEAADFDSVLLEVDPFHPAFARHTAWLSETSDDLALAALLSRRAERETGEAAAQTWLEAAAAFRRAGALERAQVCEAQAFEANPQSLEAFQPLLERARPEPRRAAELLLLRARAVPAEAPALLRQRAEVLHAQGEPLLAAAAWDDFLAVVPDDLEALVLRAELAATGGGARAAQSFDRRIVQSPGATEANRLVSFQRLGQAAVESQAWHDAVDAFEAVAQLDETGPRGREALTMLSEAYARLRDVDGQYRTTVKVAERAEGAEADALFRRALTFHEDEPELAWRALEWLLERHPADSALYARGVKALTNVGRLGELVALHERHAAAVGGAEGSMALLAAAALVARELGDARRAFALRVAAGEADPTSVVAAEAVLAGARTQGDAALVETQLRRLATLTRDETVASGLLLELAALLEQRGALDEARAALVPIRQRGASAAGYAQALGSLERLAKASGDTAALVDVQLAAAELLPAPARAAQLLEVARTWQRSGEPVRALEVARQSLAAHSSREGFTLLVDLARASGRSDELARALTQLAEQLEGVERAVLLLQAVEAWRAAGDLSQAREVLERVLREVPGFISADDAATRFLALGAPQRALEVGFTAALTSNRAARALELADAADDSQRAAEALKVLAFIDPGSAEATRYLGVLRAAGDVDALASFAASAVTKVPAIAVGLWRELALKDGRVDAAEALATRGELGSIASGLIEHGPLAALEVLLAHDSELEPAVRQALYVRVTQLAPGRRKNMLRAIATVQREQREWEKAAASLQFLVQLEEVPLARAALHVERGQLLLRQLEAREPAIAAFERALLDDGNQVVAVRELVELYRAGPADRFVALVEQLRALAGDESVEALAQPLADAYEALGRPRDAYHLLATLPQTPELLRRRSTLAESLGLSGEALGLREQVATERAEFEAILQGYLQAELVPFAVRLGSRLLNEGPLPSALLRLVAERLAPTSQGAALAARAWKLVLAEQVVDADGWTLLAEALRKLGQDEAATMADGFGAALTSTHGPAPHATLFPLGEIVPSTASTPDGLVEVADETMPRLSAALTEALDSFEVEVRVVLDLAGGVEAWLAGETVVVGAGALGAFGPAEFPFLLALALKLGTAGEALRRPGVVPGFDEAVRAAFRAAPSSLAASRVVALLDPSVRGGDPTRVDVAAVSKTSTAFRALALEALKQLE